MFAQRKYHRAEAKQRLMRFCAYQERCIQELKQKLASWGYFGQEADEIINELSAENFVDEGRFAIAYVRGKFFYKRWGKQRLLYELKQRKISAYNIKLAFAEISEDDYQVAIKELWKKKQRDYAKPGLTKKQRSLKIKNYIVGKGFEYPLVNEVIQSLELGQK